MEIVSGTGTDGSACLNTCCLVNTVLVLVADAGAGAAGPVALVVSVPTEVVATVAAVLLLLLVVAAELVGAFALGASGLPLGCVGA